MRKAGEYPALQLVGAARRLCDEASSDKLGQGQPGTKGLSAGYGKQLVCVRYRYDERTKQRVKTVELVVDRREWRPEAGPAGGVTGVALGVSWQEWEMQQQVKASGAKWAPEARVWRS